MDEANEKIIFKLKEKLQEIPNLLSNDNGSKSDSDPYFVNWKKSIIRLLEMIRGDNMSSYVEDFKSISFSISSIYVGMPDDEFNEECSKAYKKGLETAKYMLINIIEELETLGIKPDNGINKHGGNGININISQNQSQSVNLDVKNIFNNQLSNEQLVELENIIREKDKNKFTQFLENLGTGLSIEMLKTLMLSLFF